jgi:hypothetical protein
MSVRNPTNLQSQAALLWLAPLFAGEACPAGPSALRFPLPSVALVAGLVKRPLAAPVVGSSLIDLSPVWYTREPFGRLSSGPKVQLCAARSANDLLIKHTLTVVN